MSACWCDDKSNEPCDGICRLMRDNERLEADLVALREAAQAVVDSFEISDWNAQATAMDALRAVLASA